MTVIGDVNSQRILSVHNFLNGTDECSGRTNPTDNHGPKITKLTALLKTDDSSEGYSEKLVNSNIAFITRKQIMSIRTHN